MDNRSSSAHALLDSAHLHRYTGGDTGLEIELYSLLRGDRFTPHSRLWNRPVMTNSSGCGSSIP